MRLKIITFALTFCMLLAALPLSAFAAVIPNVETVRYDKNVFVGDVITYQIKVTNAPAGADVTHDGKINVSDVTTLLKHLANWESITL